MIDAKKLIEEVRSNNAALEACPRHSFEAEGPENKLGVKYVCLRCGGRIDAVSHHWYRRGLAHGAAA